LFISLFQDEDDQIHIKLIETYVENKRYIPPYTPIHRMPPKSSAKTATVGTRSASAKAESSQLALQYQQKTDKQHILDNPDTYIGSVETIDSDIYIFDESSQSIVQKNIQYNPGLYKLFDEGIVNARDHVVRMIQCADESKKNVTCIETTVGEDGTITITNDGNGIDVAKHPENDLWIPEMVFGHLRTSTNYNKEEKKIVGGKNGFGFKLVLIWSTYGRIETVDHVRGLKYVQEFKSNLDEICPPVITKCKTTKPYTTVTFKPDYARLGLGSGLTQDMHSLIKKRVYDIAAVTDHSVKKIKVLYNGTQVPIKNFQQYVDSYLSDGQKKIYEEANERWEYAVALSSTHEFQQVSFVNGICTFKGGKHVEYISGQITRKIADYIEKKKKVKVAPSSIKEQIIVFLRCDVENPSFDSQTKDCMNTPVGKFGSSCTVSDAFIEKVAKMGVMDMACSLTEAKETKQAKKTDGAKTKTVRGIANLIDANWSGGQQSKDCILILCEGLSAMSGIVSGLSREDRNIIGIYPLKGKVLNVRGEIQKKISENKEITEIKKILGLETGRKYLTQEDVNTRLRYGKVMVMTDQDLDGSHIKGLCINLFHSEWESLTQIPGFISFMNTPILRAKKGAQTLLFYNEGEYARWKDQRENSHGWTVKYFKGLGTSTSTEFKQYFEHKKIVDFVAAEKSNDTIDMVFNKKRPDDRKTWLEKYDKTAFLDTSNTNVTYEEFIDKEMIHFSKYDCERSIPNMVDGLKTSQRKILFSAFKRRLTHEIKVAQFSGYVSEHSAYHHGEASLNGAIVNMAQTFVGSNNINLLEPNGQFGTRLQGGDDSASERYIFTQLNCVSRLLFPEADDEVLKYLNDDGLMVEPEYYVPILPFVLLNGISGIGTGFSSSIPSYDPMQIIAYLKQRLTTTATTSTKQTFDFIPYYEGFTGSIAKMEDDHKFLIKGRYEKIAEDKIQITELPIGTWTMPYTTFLETLLEPVAVDKDKDKDKDGKKSAKASAPILKDMVSMCTETKVDFVLTFPKGELAKLEKVKEKDGVNGIEKLLKLSTTVSTKNMHLFDADCKLHKYDTVEEIIEDFANVRLRVYGDRKRAQIQTMESLLQKLSNRAKYIQYTLSGKIDLRRRSAQQITELLEQHEFDKLGSNSAAETEDKSYKYLIKMPMDSVSEENVEKIMREKADTEEELRILKAKTEEQIWADELTLLEKEYEAYKKIRENIQNESTKEKKCVKRKTK
jgi:DNA topoisomerase-2